jgi:hypothetical protein
VSRYGPLVDHRLREAKRCLKSGRDWLLLAEDLVEDQRILDRFWRDRFVLRLGRARAELTPVCEPDGPLWDALHARDRDEVKAVSDRLTELEELLLP